ncbi:hypothetical protein LCGC14_2040640, partial [marine sediment metagenome]
YNNLGQVYVVGRATDDEEDQLGINTLQAWRDPEITNYTEANQLATNLQTIYSLDTQVIEMLVVKKKHIQVGYTIDLEWSGVFNIIRKDFLVKRRVWKPIHDITELQLTDNIITGKSFNIKLINTLYDESAQEAYDKSDVQESTTDGTVVPLISIAELRTFDVFSSALGLELFLHQNASADIGTYRLLSDTFPDDAKTEVFNATITVDDQEVEQWVTIAGGLGLLFLPHGVYHLHYHAYKFSGTKDVRLYFKVYTRTAGGAETLLGTSEESSILADAEAEMESHVEIHEQAINDTDRIVLKIFAHLEGVGSNPVIYFYVEGNTLTRFTLPIGINSSHNSLTGVTPTQHHVATVASDLEHDDIANPNANAEEQHMTDAQITALHAIYTNAQAVAAVEAMGLALADTKVITSQNADLTWLFGRALIDSRFATMMTISNRAMSTQDQYAFGQTSSGSTYINAPTGQLIHLHINDVMKMSLSVAGLTMGIPITMGANSITLGAGQTVDGVDISARDHAKYTDANAVTAVVNADDYLKNDDDDETTGDLTVANLITAGLVDGKDVSGLATVAEALAYVNAQGLSLANTKTITSQNAHLLFNFGLISLGNGLYPAFASIQHRAMSAAGQYALLQQNNGATYLNAATGRSIYFQINAATKMALNLNSLIMDVTLAMGANSITLGAGQTVDGVDISARDHDKYTNAEADARIVVQNTHPAGTID